MKGTVFFRPSKSQAHADRVKKPGTWTYQHEVPKAGGGRRFVSKGGYSTKKEAEDALVVSLADHGRSAVPMVEPSKMPLSAYLRDQWLPMLTELKPTTRATYRWVVESYIAPRLGSVRLCDLTASQIVKMYADLRVNGRVRGSASKPLSERTVHKVHVVLTAALGHAVEAGMLRVSPMAQLPKKSRPKQAGHDRPEMHTWTANQAATFIEATATDRYAPIFDLDLNTGLRRGELAGLRWEDIDLDAGVISVRRNRVVAASELQGGAARAVHDSTPKSRKARVVDIDPETVAMLRRWRRRQLEERMAAGAAWSETGFVFTREDGVPLHPDTIGWHFGKLQRAVDVPTIRLHDLRHTHATLGLAAGVPLKVMSERLGHATTQITADLYQHVIPGMGADAASKIAGLLRRAQ